MQFDLFESIQILKNTPDVVRHLVADVPEHWMTANEGGNSWSTVDVVGHLVVGERTDWIQRTRIILNHGTSRPFEPFNRFAQFDCRRERTLAEILDEFAELRQNNLDTLRQLGVEKNLEAIGIHPDFGEVTLRQLLAAWVVHDLGHIAQIARVMAKQYSQEAGPWQQYLPVLHDRVTAT